MEKNTNQIVSPTQRNVLSIREIALLFRDNICDNTEQNTFNVTKDELRVKLIDKNFT